MIRLNRTTEYGLIALRHMDRKQAQTPAELTSAREVADLYHLPYEITAKTLQRLKDTGIIASAQGARGGYALNRRLADVSLAEFLELMEGPQGVVTCATPGEKTKHASCEYGGRCGMRSVMGNLNLKVQGFLANIPLSEITL
jgi:Rrf2 family protein